MKKESYSIEIHRMIGFRTYNISNWFEIVIEKVKFLYTGLEAMENNYGFIVYSNSETDMENIRINLNHYVEEGN